MPSLRPPVGAAVPARSAVFVLATLLLAASAPSDDRVEPAADAGQSPTFRFQDATPLLGPPKEGARNRAYGLAVGDLDGDGRPDLLLMNHGKPPSVLLNRSSRGFRNIQPSSGLTVVNSYPGQRDRHGASMGDYDNDGRVDLLVTHGAGRGTTLGIKFDQLLRNVGGRFEIVAKLNRQARSRTARLIDFDRDGRLDAYFASFHSDNVLYRAGPDDSFDDVTTSSGLRPADGEYQSWTDLDDDGWPDLLTVNPPYLYRNRGDGTFASIPLPAELAGQRCIVGMAWGDFDGDGDDDLFTACHQPGGSRLWENQDGLLVTALSSFETTAALTDAHWVDLDLDGDLDLAVAASLEVLVYENRDGHLASEPWTVGEPSPPLPGINGALALADLDLDGDLDLAINTPRLSYLLWNESTVGRHLEIRLVGRRSNRSAFGSRVETRHGDRRLVAHYLGSSNGSVTSGAAPLTFGLGVSTRATVSITWPSGASQRIEDVPADRRLVLVEPLSPEATGHPGPPQPGGTVDGSAPPAF